MSRTEKIYNLVKCKLKNDHAAQELFQKIGKQIIKEIVTLEANAKRGVEAKDHVIDALWVISGSGSYLKSLINVKSDQSNKNKLWYHWLDRDRLDYGRDFIVQAGKLFGRYPRLIYNGRKQQRTDLLKAISLGKFDLDSKRITILDGNITTTLSQIKLFSLAESHKIKTLAIVSHAPHLARLLRMIAMHNGPFEGLKIVPLPLKIKAKKGEDEFTVNEVKGTIDYIMRGEAKIKSYGIENF